MTTVANVLVTMAIAPLVTALVARFALGHRLPARTWAAVLVAGAGIAWMYANEVAAADARHLAGIAVALGVPIAAAINWTVIQKSGRGGGDLLPAVLIGAARLLPRRPSCLRSRSRPRAPTWRCSACSASPSWRFPASIAVAAARYLSAPEAALLSLLEIVFGVTWTWLGAGEVPGRHVLVGGALVIGALVANEALALRRAFAEHDLTMSPPRQPGLGSAPPAGRGSSRYHAARLSSARPHAETPPATSRNEQERPASSSGSLAPAARRPGAARVPLDARRLPLAAPPAARRRPPGDGLPRPRRERRHHLAAARLPAQPRLRDPGLGPGLQCRAAASACSTAAPPTSAPSPTAPASRSACSAGAWAASTPARWPRSIPSSRAA